MEGILAEIVERKKEELAEARLKRPLKEIKGALCDIEPPRDFHASIRPKGGAAVQLIAEIKKRSPSKGILIEEMKVDELARIYEEAGASAMSVITERRFFWGDPGFIGVAKGSAKIPALRKDFLFDEYQIFESRYIGADAILLIASILELPVLSDFIFLASELGMASLVEVHDEWELEKALKGEAEIIGINNRDLITFDVDINTTLRVIKEVPAGKTVVSESGIYSRDDVQRLGDAGVHAILAGESIVTAKDVKDKIRELLGSLEV